MARNRKNESNLKLAPILLTVFLGMVFAGTGVGYVWYKSQIDMLGHQVKAREQRLAELRRENGIRREQLATLSSPVPLEAQVIKMKLGLAPSALAQIVRLVDSPGYEQAAQQPPEPQSQPQPALRVALAARKK